jgi:pimeloyl-ACP methyl ester carboxylesterase
MRPLPPLRERSVEVDGLVTRVAEAGSGSSGEPVLLVHGSGPANAGIFTWRPVLPGLAAHRRLVVVDMPGYGRSAPLPVDDTPANVALHLVRLLDELGIDRAAVVGHSRGGRIAAELAIAAPERVDRLVVVGAGSVAPGGHVTDDGGWTAPALALVRWGQDGDTSFSSLRAAYRTQLVRPENLPDDELLETYEQARRDGVLTHFVEQMNRIDPLTFYHRSTVDEFRAALPGLRMPTLLVWGREDTCSPYRKAVPLVDMIPDVELLVLPDCEHFVMMDRPEAFVSALNAWLDRAARVLTPTR